MPLQSSSILTAVYAGSVKNGFGEREVRQIMPRVTALQRIGAPVAGQVPADPPAAAMELRYARRNLIFLVLAASAACLTQSEQAVGARAGAN